jgi:hypothetical protein
VIILRKGFKGIKLAAILTAALSLLMFSATQCLADNQVPEIPTGVKAVSNGTTITVTWNENTEPDLEGYIIYGKAKGTLGFTKLSGAILRDASYIDYDVQQGFSYVYYVQAIDDSGNISRASDEAEVNLTVKPTGPKFSDIASNAWYKQYVDKLVSDNAIGGYADGTFKPDRPVTRAEFAKMLANTALKDKAIIMIAVEFKDVKSSHWAYSSINSTAAIGALKGYKDGTFKPDQCITREEMAKAITVAGGLASGKSNLKDIGTSWAKDSIAACVSSGVITGYLDNTFRPKAKVTRAEVSAILYRLMNR